MTRVPLRPLARILRARDRGESTEAIERENLRARIEAQRDAARQRAETRLLVLGLAFLVGFALIGARMAVVASTDVGEPRAVVDRSGAAIRATRADIVDRNGQVLATNLVTNAVYAQPPDMVDPERAATELARIFPDLDAERLKRDFTGPRKFIWIKRTLSPEQVQAVHDIGEPGLRFGAREMRLYPNGRLAAHVLGGATFGQEGVRSAEVLGVAGVERHFDADLRDPGRGDTPLALSIDIGVQATLRQVLAGGMVLMNAKGAAGILMDVHTGEIIAMSSLPDFDPNDRPLPPTEGDPSDSPLFDRAAQGVYELGSAFKTFPIAQAMDLGLAKPETTIDTSTPMTWGRFKIRDFRNYGPRNSLEDVLAKSSNTGTARVALQIGAERQRDFLAALGLLEPVAVELPEARMARPLLPSRWSEISSITISYGHGLSVTPLHLAAAYASLINGGTRVTPTLVRAQVRPAPGPRVVSPETSQRTRAMLRRVITDGTASLADVEGYAVGGKTGTGDKPKHTGGYHKDKVIATFAAAFPMDAPRYVLVVTLDEPEDRTGREPRRTAGWTVAPVAAEAIRRIAPLLGMRPAVARGAGSAVVLSRN